MPTFRNIALVLCGLFIAPDIAFGQLSTLGAIAGVVRDTSGAVLPGVTIEASSPALIDKVRTAVSDGSGQYRIEAVPGIYTVTFTLPGFRSVKQESVALKSSFTTTVNVELRVGTVEETVTVTGESPVVDVQNAKGQQTFSYETLSSIPTARVYHSIVTLVPGVTLAGTQDVGGISGPTTVTFSMHGGRSNEGRLLLDGIQLGGATNGSGVSFYVPDVGNAQEIVFSTTGGLGEMEVGGPVMNIIPRTGGNAFRGTLFANGANKSMSSSNYTQALKDAGLRAPNELLKIWDTNAVTGGPIAKDRLWFFGGTRYHGNRKLVAGMYTNLNAGNPDAWTYAPNLQEQARDDGTWHSTNARFTVQVNRFNKFNIFLDEQSVCTSCVYGGSATVSPEAKGASYGGPYHAQQVTWTSPRTSKLLLEAGVVTMRLKWGGKQWDPNPGRALTRVVEQCTNGCPDNGNIAGLTYRSQNWSNNYSNNWRWSASATYVTGRHSMKGGYMGQWMGNNVTNLMNSTSLTFRFNNRVPNQLTQTISPFTTHSVARSQSGYIQDQSTFGRLTLQGAIRFDHASSYFPEQIVGPTRFITTPLVFPELAGVTGYNDITPRAGVVYDLFGNGKTAVKILAGKYLEALTNGVNYTASNPTSRIVTSVTRTWTDGNRNFVPDCDLLNPLLQDNRAAGGDLCGQISDLAFGTDRFSNTIDDNILHGWGVRPFDWGFSVAIQQQVLSRVAVEVGYYRRWLGHFTVTDNRARAASDYSPFAVAVPTDSRLPGGGGYTVGGIYDVNQNVASLVDNFLTFSHNYGNQYQYFNGVDVNVSFRGWKGLTFQGGTSTGQTVTDNCDIRAKLPEIAPLNPYCHVAPGFRTQLRGLGSYTIPRIAVQLSGTYQSNPGAALAANYTVSNALIAPTLGRNLSNNAPNATVNVLEPGDKFGDRINQLDIRIAKILRFGRARTNIGVDLYNALNSNPIQTYNQNYIPNGAWLTPNLVLPSRFAKVSAQVDF